jgi:spermidine/putrescine-binding protein
MKRRTFFLGLSGLAGCTSNKKPRLNIYNWSDYIGKTTIADFEKEFGVETRYGIFENNEEMLAKVFGGNSGWDIAFPTNYYIGPMRESRLLTQLDRSLLPNLGALDPMLAAPEWDPKLDHSVPYMWGATGIIFNKKRGRLQRWSDLWDPKLKGHMTMLDDPADAVGAALKKLGHSINTPDPANLGAAKAELLRQKPLVRAYLNAEARDQLIAGDLEAAQLWGTTSQQAIEAAPHLDFAYPAEGFARYADCAVILRESKRPELAHKFLDYLLRPEVAASIVEFSKTASANAAARQRLPAEVRNNATLYPPAEVLARAEWFAPLPPAAQRLRDRYWTEIKSA